MRLEHEAAQHAAFAGRARLRVLMGGASGLVGTRLATFLARGGHCVDRLVRASAAGSNALSGCDYAWNPSANQIPEAACESADAVVHLGGVSIAKRFTPAHKTAIRESRVQSTRLLSEALARSQHKPRVFVCASAIGLYGNRGDELIDEKSPPGDGFLPEVCRAWEDATRAARDAAIRVVNLRIGVVLSRDGGALATMLLPFRLGIGGVLGNGRQMMSWVGITDLIAMIHHLLWDESISGAVNATAPNAVSNHEFTKTLGRVLRRPTLLPAPAFAIRALLGEMGQTLLLNGARVQPAVLLRSGFRFQTPALEECLRWELTQSEGKKKDSTE